MYFLAIGSGIGFLVFLWSVWKTKTLKPDLGEVIESIVRGALMGAGFHLSCCSFYPEWLVHAVDSDTGAMVHLPANALYQMDGMHRIHVFIGGVATVFLAGYALYESCKDLFGTSDGEAAG